MSRRDSTSKLRLYPEPGTLANEEEIYGGLVLPKTRRLGPPYVLVNMVSSVDGRSSVGGKASGIGSPADRGAMRALRSSVDAVMVGAGTLRAEKLNLGLDDPDARQPLAVIVGGAGDLPITGRLVAGHQEVMLVLPEDSPDSGEAARGAQTVLRAPASGGGRVDLQWLLETLRAEHNVDSLLVEGGPTLNRALVNGRLADEIFVTIAPRLLLGPESAILSGAPGNPGGIPNSLGLLSVHSAGDEIFLRYRIEDPE